MIATDRALLDELARELRDAEASARAIPPLSARHGDLTVADAYAIQEVNVRARADDVSRPARVVGHKVGLTSEAMQQMLGVDEPDFGVLYDDRVHTSGVVLSMDGLIAPRVEPEWAFVLSADLPGPTVTAADVREATAVVIPALEVIDSRVADWQIALVDTIADNASCHCGVLGAERHPIDDVDFLDTPVRLLVDGELAHEGTGRAVLGDPAAAVAWLASTLVDHGTLLRSGQVVLSGSMTAAAPLGARQHVVADFGRYGTVEVTCS